MPQQLIQINGRVVWEAAYNSYGNVQVRVKTVENPLCLPGGNMRTRKLACTTTCTAITTQRLAATPRPTRPATA
ncbi:MAG: hypothetical protein GY796_18260 [Chloroflexi bacterium]|nr:hypothetical protein [Chloroflexota bacterium]